jgi:hypothetical protein
LSREKESLQKAQDEVSRLNEKLVQQTASAASAEEKWEKKLADSAVEMQNASSAAVAQVTSELTEKLQEQTQNHQHVMAQQGEDINALQYKAKQDASTLLALQESEASLQACIASLEADIVSLRSDVAGKIEQLKIAEEAHVTMLKTRESELREEAEKQAAEQV